LKVTANSRDFDAPPGPVTSRSAISRRANRRGCVCAHYTARTMIADCCDPKYFPRCSLRRCDQYAAPAPAAAAARSRNVPRETGRPVAVRTRDSGAANHVRCAPSPVRSAPAQSRVRHRAVERSGRRGQPRSAGTLRRCGGGSRPSVNAPHQRGSPH